MSEETQTVDTTDLTLACFLKLKGCALESIVKTGPGDRCRFSFSGVPTTWITEYNLGNASVEPVSFHATIRQLSTASRRTM